LLEMRKALFAAVPLLVLALAPTALAQTKSPADVKRADVLFKQAQKLRDAGQVSQACADFAESLRLDPELGTLLNLADCHASDGRTATALGEFEEALRQAQARKDRERESFAREQVDALAPKLSYVQLVPAPGAAFDTVTLDGAPLDRGTWSAHVALDPGVHKFVFSAEGKTARVVDVTISGPGVQTVPVASLDAIAPPPPPPPPEPAHGSGLQTLGFVLGGVGVVGLGLGSYFGVTAISNKNSGAAHCSGKLCDPQGLSLESDAHTDAAVSTVAFAVGVAALAAGAYFVLAAPGSQSAQLRVGPMVLARGGGASAGVTW
jgi:tetratricopeptide (TPR) repeat protein